MLGRTVENIGKTVIPGEERVYVGEDNDQSEYRKHDNIDFLFEEDSVAGSVLASKAATYGAGDDSPCSHFLNVLIGIPYLDANSFCVIPVESLSSFISISILSP